MFSTDELQSDARLLDRIVARDQSAVGELYDRHGRLLFGLLVRMLRDHGDAEEVLQDVFVQAWTRASTFDASLGSAAGWLIGIARHRAIDRMRSNASRRRGADAGTPAPSIATPESAAGNAERRDVVRHALALLPAEQRELIQRAYFMGATQSELAEQLKLPLGTVKTRIRSGLAALRNTLDRAFTQQ
jgi:RNA polymerase sigma-70 factor (ECF subfamily)